MSSDSLLVLDGVFAGYGKMTILNGTTARIRRAAITTVIGPNGAGKSTMFKTIFGLLSVRSGAIALDGRDVTTSIGTRLGVTDAISSIKSADTVMVAGSDDLPRRAIDPELVEAIKSVAGRTRRLASICTGSFVLAQAGLLDGRRATTHWHDVRLFARAFPEITVEPD